jgi:hypothetical protein
MALDELLAKLLLERIEALERRLAALEAQPAIRYAGVWKPGQRYPRGAACTDHGALWVCEHETDQRPGNGAENGWRLAVKRGAAEGHAEPPLARFATMPRSRPNGR